MIIIFSRKFKALAVTKQNHVHHFSLQNETKRSFREKHVYSFHNINVRRVQLDVYTCKSWIPRISTFERGRLILSENGIKNKFRFFVRLMPLSNSRKIIALVEVGVNQSSEWLKQRLASRPDYLIRETGDGRYFILRESRHNPYRAY